VNELARGSFLAFVSVLGTAPAPTFAFSGGIGILDAHLNGEVSPAWLVEECGQCRNDFRELPDLQS
jgi:hypothetical protein